MRRTFGIVFIALLSAAWVVLTAPDANAQWEQTFGLQGGDITCFAANSTTLFAGEYYTGAYVSTDSGLDWTWVNMGLTDTVNHVINTAGVTALLASGSNIFAATTVEGPSPTANGSIYRSTDNGTTWTDASTGILGYPEIFAFALMGPNLIAGTVLSGIYLSSNGGLNWDKVDTVLPSLANTFITHFAVNETNLFAGTDDSGVILSTDFGTSWSDVNNGLPFDSLNGYPFVGAIGVSGTNIFEGGIGGGVFLSTNKGTTWVPRNNGLTNDSIDALAVSGTNIFAGTVGDRVFLTTNSGSLWNDVSEGLNLNPHDQVTCFLVSGAYLLAGTTNGIWRRPLSDFGISTVSPTPTTTNSLVTYPNPFTESTTITFTTPENGMAKISVVNLLGTEVARIFSGELIAGEHSFAWDASEMAPEMYECIIEINGQVDRVPIMLAR